MTAGRPITKELVQLVKDKVAEDDTLSNSDLGALFDISPKSVGKILKGEIQGLKGKHKKHVRLTNREQRDAVALIESGLPVAAVAKKFGVCNNSVYRAWRERRGSAPVPKKSAKKAKKAKPRFKPLAPTRLPLTVNDPEVLKRINDTLSHVEADELVQVRVERDTLKDENIRLKEQMNYERWVTQGRFCFVGDESFVARLSREVKGQEG